MASDVRSKILNREKQRGSFWWMEGREQPLFIGRHLVEKIAFIYDLGFYCGSQIRSPTACLFRTLGLIVVQAGKVTLRAYQWPLNGGGGGIANGLGKPMQSLNMVGSSAEPTFPDYDYFPAGTF